VAAGAVHQSKDEVTESYAQLISDHVITLQNIGNELLHGPRSDRTQQMLEDNLRPAVDKAVGPARAAVRVAIGTKEYDTIRASVASEAATSPRSHSPTRSSTNSSPRRSTHSSPRR